MGLLIYVGMVKVRFGTVLQGIFKNPEPDHRSGSAASRLEPWFRTERLPSLIRHKITYPKYVRRTTYESA